MSGNANEPTFGPDHNGAMDLDKTIKITVPAHWKASFTFSTEAAYDNAVVIYDGHSFREIHVARNHSGSLRDYTFESGDRGATKLVVSGWHREGAGNAALPWIQSLSKQSDKHGQSSDVGFEDWTDMDFNDIAFKVKVHK
jgi:hypothetical protein